MGHLACKKDHFWLKVTRETIQNRSWGERKYYIKYKNGGLSTQEQGGGLLPRSPHPAQPTNRIRFEAQPLACFGAQTKTRRRTARTKDKSDASRHLNQIVILLS